MKDRIKNHLLKSAAVQSEVAERSAADIENAAILIAKSFKSGGKLLLCGNGGSAADCQHVAAEFVARLTKEFNRPALPAVALTTDTSFLTAYSNDFGYEGVFARQIQALGKQGDVLLALTTGGSSPNVIAALKEAKTAGMETISLIGRDGKAKEYSTVTISVNSNSTQFIQECHLSIEHIICDLVEQMLYGEFKERLKL
jgi:phosphoheptose isomerase